MLTQAALMERLSYDEVTGHFTWKPRPREACYSANIHKMWNSRYAGKRAGRVVAEGYRSVKLGEKWYAEHRLVWFYVHGEWPPQEIDHINHIRDDNRLSNLRSVTRLENTRNRSLGKANKLGVLGVRKMGEKFEAKICVERRIINLGSFPDLQSAAAARKAAEMKYGFSPGHGDGLTLYPEHRVSRGGRR